MDPLLQGLSQAAVEPSAMVSVSSECLTVKGSTSQLTQWLLAEFSSLWAVARGCP